MRRYETIFIADNDLSDEDRSPIIEKLKDLIQQHSGLLVLVDEWGSKKLAYEIKKKARGYYVRVDYCGSGILVNEIERFFRIDDRVLKYMTVLLDEDVDIEAVKEEIARTDESRTKEAESPEVSAEAEHEAQPNAEPDAEPDDKSTEEPNAEPDDKSTADDEQVPEKLEE